MSPVTETVICSLNCYPIKSCKGIQLEQAWLGKTGIMFDRYWMLVDGNGKFLTQRRYPKMALICTSIPDEILSGQWGEIPEDSSLTVSAPDHSILNIPLIKRDNSFTRLVSVWEWKGQAIDEGEEAAEWFSKFMGFETRLVRFADSQNVQAIQRRPTNPLFAPEHQVHFPDGFPILLTTTGSLDSYNMQAQQNLPMNRFRANIVVQNSESFEEDDWQQGENQDGVKLRFVQPCSRCKVTTINQTEGKGAGQEPLKSLRKFRSGAALGWSQKEQFKDWKNEIFFGWNLVVLNQGILRVGDTISMQHRLTKFPN
eukprot:TRINITY_DN32577_c0_g2_i2.p1 TRINITY_DN32577_c0_g2~~TRINITY_DN32577_c0_g2_i2.p1  ORF type:complete len:312 (-),score=38.26 TRINITY_DN32577_c0_g2_i2:1006-1941(-)